MHISKSVHEYIFMYSCGSLIYSLLELLYRGYTHFTMVLLGGICAVFIHLINKKLEKKSIILKAFFASFLITALEYACGLTVNILLGWQVWDYSENFLNLNGQICPLFSFYWFLMAFPALYFSNAVTRLSKFLFNDMKGGT